MYETVDRQLILNIYCWGIDETIREARPMPLRGSQKLVEVDPELGPGLAKNLEQSLMAIPLVAHEALTTAYINDVDGLGVFAQQLYGFGRPGDVFLGISTSGNSKNVINATVVARADGIKVIGLPEPKAES